MYFSSFILMCTKYWCVQNDLKKWVRNELCTEWPAPNSNWHPSNIDCYSSGFPFSQWRP